MMTKTSSALAVLLMLAAGVALAQTPPSVPSVPAVPSTSSTTETVAAEAVASEPEMVCRQVKSTGSRVRKETVCVTRGGSQDARNWIKNQQNQALPRASNADVNGGG